MLKIILPAVLCLIHLLITCALIAQYPKQTDSILKSALPKVTVIGKKPVLELQAGKGVYNVQNDALATGKQVNEVLENLPGVSVNASGGISINGASDIIVMINNKVSRINYSDVLKQMPASAVERIELIQGANPRYAATGAEYILNIITTKQAGKRKAGSLSTSAATNTIINLMFMYAMSRQRSNYYARISYGYNQMPHVSSYVRKHFLTDQTFFKMDGHNTTRHRMANLVVGTDQYLDSNTVLSFEYGVNLHADKFTGKAFYTAYDTIQNTVYGFENNVQTNPKEIENNFSANYQRKLTRKSFLETEFYYSIYNQSNNRISSLAAEKAESFFKSYNINLNAEVRVDKLPRLNYQAGAAYRRVRIDNQFKAQGDVQNYIDAVGVYALTTFSMGKGSLALGLRAEKLRLQSHEKKIIQKDTSFQLLSLYPSLFYKQSLAEGLNLGLSFSRKVVYPEVHFIFNSPNQPDDFDMWSGNSLLVPAIVSRVQVDVAARKKKNAYTFSGFYTHTTNTFARLQHFDGGIRRQQFENSGTRRSYGISFNLNISSLKWLTTRINSSFSFHHYSPLKHQWIKYHNAHSFSGAVTNLVNFSGKWSFENAITFVKCKQVCL